MEAKSIMPESHRQGRNLTESVITWAWTPEDRRPRSRPDRRQALPARGGRAARGRRTRLPARRPRRWPGCAWPANLSPGPTPAAERHDDKKRSERSQGSVCGLIASS